MSDPHFVGILRLESDDSDPSGNTLVVASKHFAFYDDDGLAWEAKPGDKTDGASIPWLFKPIVGRSFQTPYLSAAVLHDIYCKSKVRTWQATDEMFYEAMITNGVNFVKAGAMWSAVYSFGPHWPKPKEASP